MTAKRTIERDAKKRAAEPAGTRVMDETLPDAPEYKLHEVAARLGVHRTTLIRMDQKSQPFKARWRRKPMPHRVYNQVEIDLIASFIEARRLKQDESRNYVEETNV